MQKLIPQLATLEELLNIFTSVRNLDAEELSIRPSMLLIFFSQNSCIEKAFLFDVISKIYIATDSNPVDIQTYELCCDMMDVVIDVACIYG